MLELLVHGQQRHVRHVTGTMQERERAARGRQMHGRGKEGGQLGRRWKIAPSRSDEVNAAELDDQLQPATSMLELLAHRQRRYVRLVVTTQEQERAARGRQMRGSGKEGEQLGRGGTAHLQAPRKL